MATYIILVRWTDQGIKNVQGTVDRVRQFQDVASALKVVNVYWTQGHYDMVVIGEAPNEATMMAGLLKLCSGGNVRTETLRAFGTAEMEAILKQL